MYTFSELSEDAQSRAFEDYLENMQYDEWDKDIIWEAENELENEGVYNADFSYSGFNSQGDGGSFTGSVSLKDYIEYNALEDEFPLLYYIIQNDDMYSDYVDIYRTDHHHYHENSVAVEDAEFRGDSNIQVMLEPEIEKLRKTMENWIKEVSRETFKKLEDMYYELTDLEYFSKMAEEYDMKFEEDGERIYE